MKDNLICKQHLAEKVLKAIKLIGGKVIVGIFVAGTVPS
jgi:hypothetical protein